MRRKAAVTAGAIAAAGTLAWGVPNLAYAEDPPTDAPSDSATPQDGEDQGKGPLAERGEELQAELADRLAEELGIDADKVADALAKVGEELRAEHQAERLTTMEERLAEAVENGRITQEQADEMLEAAEDGDLRGLMGRHRGGSRAFGPGGQGGLGGGHGWDSPDSDAESESSSETTAFTF